ncbi:MAG: TPM domain-containing protein [Candidatus Aminicenantes bacterium]|nr:TPM domain-containing protein [Candidatus Aminicenantes bacterium]
MNLIGFRRAFVFLVLAGCLSISLVLAQAKIPPAPDRWATDGAGFLSRQAVAALDARLEDFERQTGHQVLVYVGRTLGAGAVLEDWAVKTFEAWKVGRRGLDDGLVLFIMAEDRKVRIEVGYGLEDRVPDIRAFRVINDILVPGFQAGRQDEAVSAAVSTLLGYITGGTAPADERGRPSGAAPRAKSIVNMIFIGLGVLVFLVILITNPSLAIWLLISVLSGGRGGGGGGGFGGGGGRSGGGGASGSW